MNIGLRLIGLGLLIASAAALYLLFGSVHSAGLHSATMFECLLALVGFAGGSAGGVLLRHGTHIFDEVEVSERWRPRR